DVEIVDDTMFVYGSRFDLLNPRTYEWLHEVVDTVVARMVRRTEQYSDDLAGPVARPPVISANPLTADPAAAGAAAGSVFDFDGDGLPRPATNLISSRGQRLRSKRWGLSAVVAILFLLLWIYDSFV